MNNRVGISYYGIVERELKNHLNVEMVSKPRLCHIITDNRYTELVPKIFLYDNCFLINTLTLLLH